MAYVEKMVIESRRTLVNTNVINKCDEYNYSLGETDE